MSLHCTVVLFNQLIVVYSCTEWAGQHLVFSIASLEEGTGHVQHHGAREDGGGGGGKICARQSVEQGENAQ